MAYKYSGRGRYDLHVVGESFYSKQIKKVVSSHPDRQPMAVVQKDLLNEHDEKAVRILIDGNQVGYLSRDDARQFHKFLEKLSINEFTSFYVPAMINISDTYKDNPGISLDFGAILDKTTWHEITDDMKEIELPKEISHKKAGCLTLIIPLGVILLSFVGGINTH